MRYVAVIIGIILLVAGIWVLTAHPSYEVTETAAKVGSLALETTTDKTIPSWAGIAGIVVGAILVLGGFLGLGKR